MMCLTWSTRLLEQPSSQAVGSTHTYALDPYYAEDNHGIYTAPVLSEEHVEEAHDLVARVVGPKAAVQFARMFTQGYPRHTQTFV
jgi:hypothetical protein